MIIQPTEQQATAIENTFEEAAGVLAELRATGKLFCTQEDELRERKKEPAPAVVPLTASTMGTPDAKPPTFNTQLEGENVRLKAGIVDLVDQLAVARGEYRVAVIEVMHDAYVEAAEIYASKAEALANAFEDLMAIDKWFLTNGLRSKLPPKFATDIHVPQLDPKTSVYLDGREARPFSICDTSNVLTEEGSALFRHARPET